MDHTTGDEYMDYVPKHPQLFKLLGIKLSDDDIMDVSAIERLLESMSDEELKTIVKLSFLLNMSSEH